MTASSFEEAQKELLRILAHHMIIIAERAGILETQGADCLLQGNAHRLWSGKAVFNWDLVQLGDFGVHEEGYQSSADYYPVQGPPGARNEAIKRGAITTMYRDYSGFQSNPTLGHRSTRQPFRDIQFLNGLGHG